MNILLLTITLVAGQAALQSGTVAGVVRDAAGQPQVGVRVAVMAAPEANGQDSGSEVLVSIGQTNEAGRYRLEVPPGRYYIVLGRVERPTYYPGVGGAEGATVIPITPGLAVNELDFVVSRLTGVVRDSAGNPEWGISVAAVDASDAKPLSNCGGVLPGATQTDDAGRYLLDVSPGRYFIIAGRLNRTTYYPAAASREDATIVSIASGNSADGLDLIVPTEGPVGSRPSRDKELYDQAMVHVRLGCYSAARLLLQTITVAYPQTPLLSDVKYAAAESFYREGTAAALMEAWKLFSEYIALYPNTPQSDEARLRLAQIKLKSQ